MIESFFLSGYVIIFQNRKNIRVIRINIFAIKILKLSDLIIKTECEII